MVRNAGNRRQLSTGRRKISHFVWSLLGHKTSENRIQPSGEAGSNPALPPRLLPFFAGRFHSKDFRNSGVGSGRKRELPGTREHLGLAMMSREWIQHLHVCLSEIVRVSRDDDEIVNERGRCDQAVLYRHRFTGFT